MSARAVLAALFLAFIALGSISEAVAESSRESQASHRDIPVIGVYPVWVSRVIGENIENISSLVGSLFQRGFIVHTYQEDRVYDLVETGLLRSRDLFGSQLQDYPVYKLPSWEDSVTLDKLVGEGRIANHAGRIADVHQDFWWICRVGLSDDVWRCPANLPEFEQNEFGRNLYADAGGIPGIDGRSGVRVFGGAHVYLSKFDWRDGGKSLKALVAFAP